MGNCINHNEIYNYKDIPIKTYKDFKGECLVTRVLDGDTVEIVFKYNKNYEKHRMRIVGIDAPEIHTKDDVEKKAGFHSKSKLEEYCTKYNDRGRVELQNDDKYGRRLGKIFINNISITDYMINNQYAYSYDGSTKKKWGEYNFNFN